jgi:peptidoglycan/LPS O-acetylase OafA/YrhL
VRNRYLDLLRAAAIVRVIVYHLFGWPWLSIAFPAMGVMFALAGSLAAASLDKRPAGKVVVSRLRRLLPPMWLLGLIAVPVMLVAGWAHETGGEHPFSLPRLAFWIFPISDPPGSDKGIDTWETLWYIRAYVWFVLLSPALYPLYRRIGWAAVAAPIALIGVLDLTGFELPAAADAVMWDIVTYGACWLVGFAHHDGRLARVKVWQIVPIAAVLGAAGLYWIAGHQGDEPWDLNDVSEAQALWSFAFVLLALRWQPRMGWLARVKPLDGAVTLLNARAVTIYLWHNIAIAVIWPVLVVLALDDVPARMEGITELVTALGLTLVAVLLFGWAEDLAAKRRPRIWPARTQALLPETPPDEPAPLLIDAGDVPVRDNGRRTGAAAAMSAMPRNSGAAAAMSAMPRNSGAAAAMSAMPRNWPPLPRTARTGDDWPAATGGQSASVGEFAVHGWQGRHSADGGTRDLGLPVAGRRVEPMPGEPAAAPGLQLAGEALAGEALAGEALAGEALAGEVLAPGAPGTPVIPWAAGRPGNETPDWFLHRREHQD